MNSCFNFDFNLKLIVLLVCCSSDWMNWIVQSIALDCNYY